MTMTAASLPYYKSHDKAIAEHTLASVFSCIYDNVILEHNSKCDVHSKTCLYDSFINYVPVQTHGVDNDDCFYQNLYIQKVFVGIV